MIEIKAKGPKRAELFIYEDIGEGMFDGITGKQFAKDLQALGDIDQLDVRINSMGGSVFDGISMYNLLLNFPAAINVEIDGIAASIASVIAMAGDRISMAENAFMMIHKPWAPTLGNADEHRSIADKLDKVENSIVSAYQRKSPKSKAEIQKAMSVETWFEASAAKEFGLITDITEPVKMAAYANGFGFRNMPKRLIEPPKWRSKERGEKFAHMRAYLHNSKL